MSPKECSRLVMSCNHLKVAPVLRDVPQRSRRFASMLAHLISSNERALLLTEFYFMSVAKFALSALLEHPGQMVVAFHLQVRQLVHPAAAPSPDQTKPKHGRRRGSQVPAASQQRPVNEGDGRTSHPRRASTLLHHVASASIPCGQTPSQRLFVLAAAWSLRKTATTTSFPGAACRCWRAFFGDWVHQDGRRRRGDSSESMPVVLKTLPAILITSAD